MFQNIPDELRMYPQWVVWRYEESEGGKPTKVPYSPIKHCHADVNDPSTWATFEQALNAGEKSKGMYAGLGFVLTYSDPFGFIDLDDPYERKENGEFKHDNPDEVMQRQIKIYNEFNSYAERSPSGNGLHILVKGNVESGRKRASVEVYSGQRFMTVTGNVYRTAPINEYNDLLNALWDQMGQGRNATSYYAGLDHARLSDDEVLKIAAEASNGEKFCDLFYDGNWQKYYPSQSEADLALIDIIAYYSENRYQVQNLFLASKLGQREKSRAQYRINYMLAKCFDNKLPPVDIDGLRDKIQAAVEKRNAEEAARHRSQQTTIEQPAIELEPERYIYTAPPGLIGDIARFIYAQAPRPVPEIALAGAIGLVAGIVGRAYNVSGTGLNQYVLLLAGTGTGKEAIASGIDKLMNQVIKAVPSAKEFLGPGEIASPQALTKYLSRDSNSFVSLIGEFGLMLRQMSALNAPPHLLGLRRMLLDLYNKSGEGKTLRPTIYSDKEKNTAVVHAPALTMLGESTPERFYDVLNEDMISEGLLPRFTIIEYYGQRPDLNENHNKVQPQWDLVEKLSTLCAHALSLNSAHRAVHVLLNDQAKADFDKFNDYCDSQHRNSEREIKKGLWTRAQMKALKLAAVVAVGCNPYDPTIDAHISTWAINLVLADVKNLLNRFDAGEIGVDNNEQKQLNEVVKVVKAYCTSEWDKVKGYLNGWQTLHQNKIVPFSYLSRRLIGSSAFKNDRKGASKAIEQAVRVLVDRGDLQEVSRATLVKDYNVTAKCFMISSLEAFNL